MEMDLRPFLLIPQYWFSIPSHYITIIGYHNPQTTSWYKHGNPRFITNQLHGISSGS